MSRSMPFALQWSADLLTVTVKGSPDAGSGQKGRGRTLERVLPLPGIMWLRRSFEGSLARSSPDIPAARAALVRPR